MPDLPPAPPPRRPAPGRPLPGVLILGALLLAGAAEAQTAPGAPPPAPTAQAPAPPSPVAQTPGTQTPGTQTPATQASGAPVPSPLAAPHSLPQPAGHGMDILSLFLASDIIIKAVMLSLLLASVWSWAIIIDKWIRLARLNGKADVFEDSFWSGGEIDRLYKRIGERPGDPMSATFVAGMREFRAAAEAPKARPGGPGLGLIARVERVMQVTIGRELAWLEKGLVTLASIGAISPFIGLFGTVWGIINSFNAIAAAQNTSLVVVAPGIAEALFTTALGLAAAIPAVVFYNKLSSDVGRYGDRLDSFSTEFSAILERHLEEEG